MKKLTKSTIARRTAIREIKTEYKRTISRKSQREVQTKYRMI